MIQIKSLIKSFIVVIALVLSACNNDFLNTKPLGEVSQSDVWKDGPLSEAFVTEIYTGLGQGGLEEMMLSLQTDEALFTHPDGWRGNVIINEDTRSASNPGNVNGTYEWGNMYRRIRAANVAILNLETATFDDEALKARLKGEAHFLRGYYYHQLTRYYGGVPIIDKTYDLGEPDYTVARNTYEECVDFILADCDLAAQLLEGKTPAKGRATKDASLALKARVLLYAASDLYDIPTATGKSSVLASFQQPELLGYTSGDRIERWQKAKDAAKAIVDIQSYGYKLNLAAPVTPEEGTANYIAIAMGGASKVSDPAAASEIIFGRHFSTAWDEGGGQWVGRNNGPNGYHNWAGNTPTQQLVDDYEMMDGTKFDWNNSTHAQAPYKNRDPRFYATILFDGADWKPRDKISGNVDPANQIQTGQYEIVKDGNIVTIAGLDTRSSSIEDWNGSYTGYYMRKFIDPDPAIVDNNTKQNVPWPFLRYTEAVLNYVEACLELGEEAEAKDWLNKIRFRAGMPAVTESGEALMERYRNERRIELVYEEHRYHDARRWMIAPETQGRKVEKIKVFGDLKEGASVNVYRYSEDDYNYTYTKEILEGHENRSWNDRRYFVPIHRDEINRNDKLIQNPGY